MHSGLTSQQVQDRVAQGLVNKNSTPKTKSYGSIIASNVFTFFNIVNIAVAVLILSTGISFDTLKNIFFIFVVIFNSVLSILQQFKAKKAMDKLQIISSLKANVIRDGKKQEIDVEQVVLDDVLVLSAGNQIVADCVILSGSVDVDESMLTGEADAVNKNEGDSLLSGSFVISGKVYARVTAVGEQSYSAKVTKSAKRLRKNTSEILNTIMLIIKFMTVVNVPLGALLYFVKVFVQGWEHSEVIISIGGSVIGMMPEGLVLLTTAVFTLTSLKLGLQRILSQDMYSAESLARVDVLCLDKTGTLTSGEMTVQEVMQIDNSIDLQQAISAFISASDDDNATINALRNYYKSQSDVSCTKFYPFNSAKKMSCAYFENKGSLVLGAADYISDACEHIVEEKSKTSRVIMLACCKEDYALNPDAKLKPIALFMLKDNLREKANETLSYFEQQGVTVKIISGDNLNTVKMIAKQSKVKNANMAIDMSRVKDEEIADICEKYTVFARVTPEQKKLLVISLKEHGHHVAMTGDGVNDVMALREADCSIAMAQGTDAAKNVSQLVLLDSNFDSLPSVVNEGRRSINNLKRSASLFLVKTIFSFFLTIIFLFIPQQYPFEPIQLTLVSMLATGTPSTLLALEPNFKRIKGKFLTDILVKSVPAAVAFITGVCMCSAVGMHLNLQAEISTMCVIVAGSALFLNLARVCMPFNLYRGVIFTVMFTGFVLGNIFLKSFFSLVTLNMHLYLICAVLIVIVFLIYFITQFTVGKIAKRINKKEP
ncbi:MAG: HAD-IC family P-type ATPase [Acutalibacteraceae bacterium]|nr:HAD-IC family P-type ATPase [Acutalibacteraceae bacterium]